MLAKSEKEFIEFFNTVDDVREDGKILYPLNEILFLCIVAVLCCAEGWDEIIEYGERHLGFLRGYFPYEHGIPSRSVLSRVFGALCKKQVADFLVRFARGIKSDDEIIALDGKRLRGSDIHLLHAFATRQGLVIAQKQIDNKVNESPVIPEVLDELEIKGAVITADALNCQKPIAEKVREKGADYFLALKANQKLLLEDVQPYFSDVSDDKFYEELDKGHGRIEVRRCYSMTAPEWLKERHPGWQDLRSICIIKSERHIKNKIEKQVRYYLSSTEANSKKHLEYARSHWGIENNLHWVLDMVFHEDQATLSARAAHNMAAVRKVVLNLLKKHKAKTGEKTALKTMRKVASWSEEAAQNLLNTLIN